MNSRSRFAACWIICLPLTLVSGCSTEPNADTNSSAGGQPGYVVLDRDLRALKADFNAARERVRLVFLSGPTCAICLRGMADLNDAFIAAMQKDERLITFVVHVPTLGAEERHIEQTIPLMQGPRVKHYWDKTGISGVHYQEIMEVEAYVWDFWAMYEPGAVWEETLPPSPDYWEHQLFVFPPDKRLDADRFAAHVREALSRVRGLASLPSASDAETENLYADGSVLPHIAQPRGYPVQQHIMGRGGYRALKEIQSIQMEGTILASDLPMPITIRAVRPDTLERIINANEGQSVGRRANGIVEIAEGTHRGLPADIERLVLDSFDFDGPFVEWKAKGHDLERLPMEKHGRILAWVMALREADGREWRVYVDSHTGDIFRSDLLNDRGSVVLSIRRSDFREVEGIRFPSRIDYQTDTGKLLATELIRDIRLTRSDPALEARSAPH